MDLNQLQDLENRVGFPLPKHYKDFLLNYPQELKDLRLDTYFFANHVDWLVEIILAIPSHLFFPIGMDLGGNYFYLKRNGEDSCVYYRDHEEEVEDENATLDMIIQPKYANLEEFKEFLIDVWGELLKI
jgi:hypothetical protein